MKTYSVYALYDFVQRIYTWYKSHEFQRGDLQRIYIVGFPTTHLHETCTEVVGNL